MTLIQTSSPARVHVLWCGPLPYQGVYLVQAAAGNIAFISLGSNQGESEHNLQRALEYIGCLGDVKTLRISSVYWTQPQGVTDQPWFANQVAMVQCGPVWTAEALLGSLLEIENKLGRVRVQRWGPRTMDLDLLFFGNQTAESAHLQIPHPRMHQRAFVLVPLQEIAPDLSFPSGETVQGMLTNLSFTVKDHQIWQQEDQGQPTL